MRQLLPLLTLLLCPAAMAQDTEEALEALEMDFADELATRSRKASRVMHLEAAAAEAVGWDASTLWDETRYAARDLFATTEALVGTAREIEALALTLPASTHGHLHARAADLVQRTSDLAAQGLGQVVASDLRTAASFQSTAGPTEALMRVGEAMAFLEGRRHWLARPDQVDRFYDETLLVALETSTARAGRDLGRQCLALCTEPSTRILASATVGSWEQGMRAQTEQLHALGKRIHLAPAGTAHGLTLVGQLDSVLMGADGEEERLLRAAVPVELLRLTAAERAGPSRDLSLLESAWGAADQVAWTAHHPREAAEARRVRRRLERVPLAWATARVGAPTRLEGGWRQPVGVGLAVLPRTWLQLEALGTWEIPLTGDLWTGRMEARVGVVPGADPAWEWTRAALRPVAGGGLVWGPDGQTGWTASGGLQLERVRRSWRSDSRVRVVGLEATWALTRLGESSWSTPTAAVYLGRGTVPWSSPGPRGR